MKPKTRIILILIITMLAMPAFALEPIVIDKTLTQKGVGLYMEYLKDEEGKLTFEDVRNREYDDKWIRSEKENPGFGYTDSVYWVRFAVQNISEEDIEFYLEQALPHIDILRLYIYENNSIKTVETGDRKLFSERPIENKNFVFPIKLKSKCKEIYYLYYNTYGGAMNISLHIFSPDSFRKSSSLEYHLLMLFYGMVLVMILYNLIVFFFIRRWEYLLYSIFVFFIVFLFMGIDGISFQFIWPDSPWWANFSHPIILNLMMLFVNLFIIEFVGLRENEENKKYRKIIYKVIMGLVYCFVLLVLMGLFLPHSVLWKISVAMAGISMLCIGSIGSILIKKEKNRPAILGMIASSPIILGTIAYVLKSLAVIPSNFFTQWSIYIGVAIMVVLFSIALADRINTMREDLAVLNTSLEEKVKERTEELMVSNKELEATNQKLTETRDALWGEMELAKKIQTMLLPEKPEIPGYEISVYMNPADEVGGDYYDIINADGYNWLVIGDVSGHGVPAGLVMIMAQTSINYALSREPDIPPSKLLTAINGTIAKNIKRISDDKYMTMTVLASMKEGRFRFSGLHQDILVYRADTGKVDSVETMGTWIGVRDNIDGMNIDSGLSLNIGDAFLLYTDGITEAWKRGSLNGRLTTTEDMFGEERLVETFGKLGTGSPEEIKDGILKELEGYECHDDVTIVVLKRIG